MSAYVVANAQASSCEILGNVWRAVTSAFPVAHVMVQIERAGHEETHL